MKKSFMDWVRIVIIAVSLLSLTAIYIFVVKKPINSDAKKYVEEYINNSVVVDIGVIEKLYDHAYYAFYTGDIIFRAQRSVLSGVDVGKYSFYDEKSNKYFSVILIGTYPMQSSRTIYDLLQDRRIKKARINKFQLNDLNYGTKENPIPILFYEIPTLEGDKDYEMTKLTEEWYKTAVYYYLAYFMPKSEFNKMFKERKEPEFQYYKPITIGIVESEASPISKDEIYKDK